MDSLTIVNLVFFGLLIIFCIYIAKSEQLLPRWFIYVIGLLLCIDILAFLLMY